VKPTHHEIRQQGGEETATGATEQQSNHREHRWHPIRAL
jgi:hypothetical protein